MSETGQRCSGNASNRQSDPDSYRDVNPQSAIGSGYFVILVGALQDLKARLPKADMGTDYFVILRVVLSSRHQKSRHFVLRDFFTACLCEQAPTAIHEKAPTTFVAGLLIAS